MIIKRIIISDNGINEIRTIRDLISFDYMRYLRFKDGMRDGFYKLFDNNGKLYEEKFYRMERLHGPCRYYHETGNLSSEYNYENGDVQGICKHYQEDGSLLKIIHYKNGVRVKSSR